MILDDRDNLRTWASQRPRPTRDLVSPLRDRLDRSARCLLSCPSADIPCSVHSRTRGPSADCCHTTGHVPSSCFPNTSTACSRDRVASILQPATSRGSLRSRGCSSAGRPADPHPHSRNAYTLENALVWSEIRPVLHEDPGFARLVSIHPEVGSTPGGDPTAWHGAHQRRSLTSLPVGSHRESLGKRGLLRGGSDRSRSPAARAGRLGASCPSPCASTRLLGARGGLRVCTVASIPGDRSSRARPTLSTNPNGRLGTTPFQLRLVVPRDLRQRQVNAPRLRL
jgi:hypothetical protein